MPRYVDFIGRDGQMYRAEQRGENSALPFIQKRMEYYMPKETVVLSEVEQIIKDFKINYYRNITPQESKEIFEIAKTKIIEKLEELNKYYVSREEYNQE